MSDSAAAYAIYASTRVKVRFMAGLNQLLESKWNGIELSPSTLTGLLSQILYGD